ncbi:serine hydrolase domain-containing protein [Paraburkholderia silvatlantica]|uniref:CubicO group peptidase (Beta-lactamase class C family) n=1 Tax=Paraburkholderia silvatlantica TaxID=321895 RepID=A0ABR6FHH4_9BURK|nr:serine hydrolase domain-containing protein [Paraburkholderia silvatlantica]MBB2926861.1 CubicO group peptidase (beta-lactamase class C family) [Paraburkholderia silvatlantica]PVY37514.1 CubicO group peptidase (beta-lactamase class C family) [Paraburkholderia silvatlantica]PXW42476.1 CubicO group peptidase (beta-lactamase class C family) [Paraburkholderia silvatlantica]
MGREGLEKQGMSCERLARIERFLGENYVAPGTLAGAVTQVWRRGELALNSVLGFADRERRTPMAEDSIFRIYSMTKPITSVAIMMLVEECKIALDDPVSKYIPSWEKLGVYAGGFMEGFQTRASARPMRVVDLLRHTSGLTYGFQQNTNVDAAYRKLKVGELATAGTLDEMIEKLATLPLEFSPGDAWNYSVSTDVLGYLVGKVSGMAFEDFLKTRIFDPLGMVDTAFYVPQEKVSRFCACYAIGALGSKVVSEKGPELQDDPHTSAYREPPSFVSGGGGLVSTAADYMRFARMLLQGGELDGVRLLGPKTIELTTANHLPGGVDLPRLSRSMFTEAAYDGVGFGLGFATTIAPASTLIPGSAGDFFWGGAASTFFWVDPREDMIVLFLTQLLPSTAYPIRRQLRTLVYSAITECGR